MKSTNFLGNATNRAYRGIKEMIFNYELIPGQKIIYDRLSAKLKMSKTPIINALYRLEQEEFVISFPNRGFFIREIDPNEFENLHRIREALEMLAVEGCLKKGDSQTLKEIEQAMVTHRNYHEFVSRRRYALDLAFHLKIAEKSQNENLLRMLKQVWEQIYFRQRTEGFPPTRFLETPKEHLAIVEAMKDGNLLKAKKLMKKHIKNAEQAALTAIKTSKQSYDF